MPSLSKIRNRYFLIVCSLRASSCATSRLESPSATSHLARTGHEVTIYCRTYCTPPQRELNGVQLVRLPTVRSKHFESVIHTLRSSLHVLLRPCDVVQYHTLGSALFS